MLEDVKINVKIKLALFWGALMLCYLYGDFFSLFVPGRIKGLMEGQSGAGPITPVVLLLYALMLSIPPVMIILLTIAKPKIIKVLNIIAGLFFTVVMLLVVATSISKWMIFYTYLGTLEIIITLTIVRYAWKWPKAQ